MAAPTNSVTSPNTAQAKRRPPDSVMGTTLAARTEPTLEPTNWLSAGVPPTGGGERSAYALGVSTTALIVAVAALLVALGAAALGWVAHQRHQLIQRRYAVLWGEGEADVATVLAQQARRMGAERSRIDAMERTVADLRGDLAQTLQHVAVVRYDAFGDMGGRMSFSAAVIDDNGDGVVISSIHARGESRTYAKGIVGGGSDTALTPEEQQALAAARDDSNTGAPPAKE